MRLQLLATALLVSAAGPAGDAPATFTSSKAWEAQKTYLKAMEKLKADYDSKVNKARMEYLKSLETALREVSKSNKKKEEVEQISKAIAELRTQLGSSSAAPAAARQEEKGPGKVTFAGGNGESIEQAVVIKGAEDSPGAVDAEGHWIMKHYPRFKKTGQALLAENGKKFDEIEITGPGGEVKKVYFDITACFGFPK